MKIKILGSGTSTGVPIIGCSCHVCLSEDIRDKRTRPGLLIVKDDFNLLIDASQDLREQLLKNRIDRIDGIIITHAHADHIFGLDDTRMISKKYKKSMEIFCTKKVEREIRRVYAYVFNGSQEGGGKPKFSFYNVENLKNIGPFSLRTFDYFHGNIKMKGFILDQLVILMDGSYIDMKNYRLIKKYGKHIIINGLRTRLHPTHFSISEAIFFVKSLGFESGFLVHISDSLKHKDMLKIVPENIFPTYDCMEIEI
ncbi:MAG: MBL fold metallo-hydrolase [candidate division WOR-3 bacterium]